jgi:hypothetical protein
MGNVRGIARLGTLAVGLGLGAAWAHTPVASADSSTDWLSSIDSLLGGSALPAPSSGLDLAISFDGYSLFQDGSATADTTTGDYSLAIAVGEGAGAYAYGTEGSAYADGIDADAISAGGTGDMADAEGTEAVAWAGGQDSDTGADDDTAIDIGNNASTGIRDGALAGNADLNDATASGTGSHDTAIDIGNNTDDGSLGGYDGAFAGAGGLTGGSGDGNNDTAIDVGNNSGDQDGSQALDGNGNYASESGSITGGSDSAFAGLGNDNTAVSDVSYTNYISGVFAGHGNDNYASGLGPENSYVYAGDGDSNIAYVSDPFDAAGSPDTAIAGDGFSNDLAEVLLAHGNATADTANLLYDIVSLFGNTAGSF